MDQDLKKMKKLAKMMREQGILVYKTAEIELQLSPKLAFPVEQSTPKASSEADPATPTEDSSYTEEEILFWSSPGLTPEGSH